MKPPSWLLALAVTALGTSACWAQAEKVLHAKRVNPHVPQLDGQLNDQVWQTAEFVNGFDQKEPNEGVPAANQTEVAMVYDDDALYIAARMHCVDPDKILATVSRRDNSGNSERVIVSLDTYRDRRTAYTFAVTASGTRIDYYHASDNEGDRDYEFDPVWEARTARTADGWTAEMRIPFTQLRFADKNEQVWGVNINRWVPTGNEDSYWIVVPKDEQGWSSRMGEVTGISGIQPSRRVEFLPYTASEATVQSNPDAGDPFNSDGRNVNVRAGGDFRMGVGPNLTLEGTVNPDFGQVEADPAEVNLSAFETFFSERRPFFTEGANLFSGGGSNFFYSRRIGAPPHGDPDGDYFDRPKNTSILGAAKLTGRLNSGLSIGAMAALTERERADVYNADTGETSRVDIEPTSGYGVLRLQQEFGNNASTAGIILTAVERDVSSSGGLEDILRKRAYSGGADWNLRFRGGDYILNGSLGFSHIRGTEAAILEAQRSSAHYFQRPDASHVDIDSTATSMSGWVARSRFEKIAGAWLWGGGFDLESPGFEINDVGILGSADDASFWSGGRYRQNNPGTWYQNYWLGTWIGRGYNFDGDHQFSYLDTEASLTFKNYYGLWAGFEFYPEAQSDDLTRGGPSMRTPSSWIFDYNAWSNVQGRVHYWIWGRLGEDANGGNRRHLEAGVTYRPGSRWELQFNPRWFHINTTRQYVDTFSGGPVETYGKRYVFAALELSQMVAQFRANYAFTPDFTLEAYMEPFAASGRYHDHGQLVAPRTDDLLRYGTEGTTITRDADGVYTVTDGVNSFEIDNLDFNYVSLRSNLVLRWEYSPGSTLFVVWQQDLSDSTDEGRLVRASDLGDAFTAEGNNFFAIKLSYWIPFL